MGKRERERERERGHEWQYRAGAGLLSNSEDRVGTRMLGL